MKGTLLFALFFVCSQLTMAQTSVWDGDSDGDGDGIKWDDPQNWADDEVPKEGSIVEIANDSVIVADEVVISRLILQPNAILYQESGNGSDGFRVLQSLSTGVTIDGSAKLYINGRFDIKEHENNAIDLQVNGTLTVQEAGLLYINQITADGLLGGIGGVFLNDGQVQIENIGGDGMDVRSFENNGTIGIENTNGAGAKISTANGLNKGDLVTEAEIIIQSSAQFVNGEGAEIRSSGGISVVGDFLNNGEINCRNTSGVSLLLASSDVFTNNGSLRYRISNDNNIRLSNNAQFINGEDGVIAMLNSGGTAIPDVFSISLQSSDPFFINRGKIVLDLKNIREGIEIKGKGSFLNYDSLYVSNYYSKGIVVSEDFSRFMNIDTSLVEISQGFMADAVGLSATNRADVDNAICANFIVRDSVAISGINVDFDNSGFLAMEKLFKNYQADLVNNGAVYLADSTLATNSPAIYIDQITNNGLVYHPLEAPIITGSLVQPFFRKNNSSFVEISGNQIFVKNSSGLQTPAGQVNTGTNTWLPPANAAGKDSVFFNYRRNGSACPLRNLTIPFISNDPCSTPQTLTFNGNTNDSWNQSTNWTPNRIPQPCDTVIIPSGKRCVIYNSYAGGFGNAKKILVENGAVFETQSGAILDVDPN